ncbi:MAG: hypothetical protein LR015_03590 [Verrucomicrobia bacterium]|nr:hypothetical protein [Verrucomicrobiota bacterium]
MLSRSNSLFVVGLLTGVFLSTILLISIGPLKTDSHQHRIVLKLAHVLDNPILSTRAWNTWREDLPSYPWGLS